jgi:signal peptidase I
MTTPEASKTASAPPQSTKQRIDWEFVKTIAFAVALAVVFRSFAYEPFHIPSGSMKSTLLVGDYIWVSKHAYGYSRFSFPFALPLFEGRIMESMPERGDLVVFRPPSRPRTDYIKRVIGLPGDKIQMQEGRLYINGARVEQEALPPFFDHQPSGTARKIMRFEEKLPGGVTHEVLDSNQFGPLDDTGVYSVPEGHVFMMGDNRDESVDSRVLSDVGFIPLDHVVGKARLIFLSVDGSARLWEIWKWPSAIRWDRLMQWL